MIRLWVFASKKDWGRSLEPNPIRVLILDDHPVVRAGIQTLLQLTPDIKVVGEASTGAEAIQLVNDLRPDVLLLDVELPDMTGGQVARQLREAGFTACILALSAYDDKQFVLDLLDCGANGYLVKGESEEMLIEAIRGVAKGEQGWFSRTISASLPFWLKEQAEKTKLTKRELQVLRAVVAGRPNQEIAVQLGIHKKTVEKHLEEIYSKLGVQSRVEAAVVAVRDGLV